jgi:hypothetical protein
MPYADKQLDRLMGKVRRQKWYAIHKNDPGWPELRNKRMREWRAKYPAASRGNRYRGEQKRRLVRFLRGGRAKKDYDSIICSCGRRVLIPFKKQHLADGGRKHKEPWIMLYRRMLDEAHRTTFIHPAPRLVIANDDEDENM